ncbi:MAG TPA: hypothetical protein VJA63_00640 [Candidatus Paceibacterota bacterium]
MIVHLLFRPTRTREYTHTILDLVNDMFVPCTSLAAVCLTAEAAVKEGSRLVAELRDEKKHPTLLDHHQLEWEFRVWEKNVIKLWQDAVHNFQLNLEGVEVDEGQEPPTTVWVVLQKEKYRAWGGEYYETYRPYRVFTDKREARRAQHDALVRLLIQLEKNPPTIAPYVTDYVVVEMPLLGIPAAFTASK